MQSQSHVVRAAAQLPGTWGDNGGTTREIAREPADGEFVWRLSLASIERPAPFSSFPGRQRALTLISGGGCRLIGAAEQPLELRDIGATAFFPGDAPVTCELLAEPCTVLNLIVAAPRRIVYVEQFALFAHETESLRAEHEGAVFCIAGSVDCLQLGSGERAILAPGDALIAPAHEAAHWRLLRGGGPEARVVVYAWRSFDDPGRS